jgi:hypothetical protein
MNRIVQKAAMIPSTRSRPSSTRDRLSLFALCSPACMTLNYRHYWIVFCSPTFARSSNHSSKLRSLTIKRIFAGFVRGQMPVLGSGMAASKIYYRPALRSRYAISALI